MIVVPKGNLKKKKNHTWYFCGDRRKKDPAYSILIGAEEIQNK